MRWQKVKLGELGEFRNGLNYSKANEGSGLKVISVKDFGDLRVPNFAELDEINPSGLNIRNSLLAAGDIIFVRSNGNKDLIGRSMFIEKAQENVSFSGFCIRFRNQSNFAHSKFLAYYFRSPVFRRTLSNLGGGTNINNLNQGVLGNFPILLPSLDQQETILRTLSAYDDLIENNRRRIGLLEQAARLLYRDWFVHLRFPGHETAKIVDGLPEGWRRVSLGDKAEIRKGRNITKETVSEGSVPVVAGGLKPAYFHNTANVKGPVITISASGANAGHVGLYFQDIWASDCSFISATENPHLIFIHQTLRQNDTSIRAMQKGAAQPHVYPKDLQRLTVVWPTEELIEQFLHTAAPSYRQIEALEKQSVQLTRARDLLLPRLMDGRIPV